MARKEGAFGIYKRYRHYVAGRVVRVVCALFPLSYLNEGILWGIRRRGDSPAPFGEWYRHYVAGRCASGMCPVYVDLPERRNFAGKLDTVAIAPLPVYKNAIEWNQGLHRLFCLVVGEESEIMYL